MWALQMPLAGVSGDVKPLLKMTYCGISDDSDRHQWKPSCFCHRAGYSVYAHFSGWILYMILIRGEQYSYNHVEGGVCTEHVKELHFAARTYSLMTYLFICHLLSQLLLNMKVTFHFNRKLKWQMARDNKRQHMSTIAQYMLCEEKAE